MLIKNKYATHNLNEFEVEWSLLKNGQKIQSGVLDCDVVPLSEKVISVPYNESKIDGWENII